MTTRGRKSWDNPHVSTRCPVVVRDLDAIAFENLAELHANYGCETYSVQLNKITVSESYGKPDSRPKVH